ncbi:MAG: DnaA ATPase domain-containing protein [Roseinatronobacter sp.]
MIAQSPLPLVLPASYARADFVQAPCNHDALALINAAVLPSGKLVVTGPEGSGKTHLLHVWATAQKAVVLPVAHLAQLDLAGLRVQAVALDDASAIATDQAAQTALFHLHNLLAERGGQLLLTARAPVRDWGLTLPDLASRLQAATHVTLGRPDDDLLAAVLAKHFADRQVRVPDTLIPFLLARIERSLGAAQRVAALLDTESLARGKPITRAFAAEVLQGELGL